ncbi:MAG TPA: hypothetical protein DEP23_04610 [Ruminococcaceae bacterium]|nr:hypothetical protein [Oscillospiraceae bacterium]
MPEMTLQECIARLEDLIQDRKSFFSKDGNDDVFRTDAAALEKAVSMLHKIAAGEYKLVVHGHWINYYEPLCSSPHANCSICSHLQTFNEYCGKIYAPRYCENCGAPMDGKDEEN